MVFIEFEDSPYTDSQALYQACHSEQLESLKQKQEALQNVLRTVHAGMGRDSATVISFSVDVGDYTGVIPSNQ